MSIHWDNLEERRRFFLTMWSTCDDLRAVNRDMVRRPWDRELGAATHAEKCNEGWQGIFEMLRHALVSSGGLPPGGEPGDTEGGPPLH